MSQESTNNGADQPVTSSRAAATSPSRYRPSAGAQDDEDDYNLADLFPFNNPGGT